MKKLLCAALAIAIAAGLFACEPFQSELRISVSFTEGVEGVVIEQGGERLMPVNGLITPVSSEGIVVTAVLKEGYRKSAAKIYADGEIAEGEIAPNVSSIHVEATPNSSAELTLISGEGYSLDVLYSTEYLPGKGSTEIFGLKLSDGYAQSVTELITEGCEAEAITLAYKNKYGLDGEELISQGYVAFYRAVVLEDCSAYVSGVRPTDPEKDLVTISYDAGQGYILYLLKDAHGTGIGQKVPFIAGKLEVERGADVLLYVDHQTGYKIKGITVFANGTPLTGTQLGGYYADAFTDALIYPFKAEGNIHITVEGVTEANSFYVELLRHDGTLMDRDLYFADSLRDAMVQIPWFGVEGREEYFPLYWEAQPEGYEYRYWINEDGKTVYVDLDYKPEHGSTVYAGYVKASPSVPDSLKEAMAAVCTEDGQWANAFAAWLLLPYGVDLGRMPLQDYENAEGLGYNPCANNMYVYMYDMAKTGSSDIDIDALVRWFNSKYSRSTKGWAALPLKQELGLDYTPGTKLSAKTDEEKCKALIFDYLGIEWELQDTVLGAKTKQEIYDTEGEASDVLLQAFAFMSYLDR